MYQKLKHADGRDDWDTYGVSASYDFGFMALGADYSETDDVAEQYNLAAVFPVASTTAVAVGVADHSWDDGYAAAFGEEDATEWYANVTYKFPAHKNVSVFAEIADSDADDADLGFLAGMRVQF